MPAASSLSELGAAPARRSPQDLAAEEQLVWYCMACEKHFKSEAALDNHERSKKHLQQVRRLPCWPAPAHLG